RPHILGVGGIAADSFAVIVAPSLSLAIRATTDALLWSISGRLKKLLAVPATPARSHAAVILLRALNSNPEQNKTVRRKNIETFCRVLTASLPLGLSGLAHWLRLTPAKLAPSLIGTDRKLCARSWTVNPAT